MATGQPRATDSYHEVKGPSGINAEEDTDGDRCSYEERRNKRVAKMRQMMLPLERASKISHVKTFRTYPARYRVAAAIV